ncbi:PAS domain S-box protein, partial [Candidatus Woesearchaeota archaeon]|nr:PAS domain S-box protein [Candidatus Woesearchaeota archaeon]
ITEIKDAEKIYPTLHDMLIVINKDKKIQLVNAELQKNLGYNKKQLMGQEVDILFDSDKNSENIFNFEKIKNLETQMITKNKEKIPVQISTKRLIDRNDEQNGLIIVVRDITEIKTSEQKLKRYVEKLEKNELAMISMLEDLKISEKNINNLNKNLEQKVKERSNEIEKLLKQKDEFIDQLSHDLKNPLTPLTTLLPIIKKKTQDEEVSELVDVAIRNTKYIKNLVKNTLHLARLNSPNTKLNYEEFNLLEKIQDIIKKNKLALEKNRIVLDLDFSQNLNIEADKLKIEELINNLISNSIKYSPKKSIIRIKAEDEDDFVKISISDEGVGMTEEQINHIFDEFYKIDESRSDYFSTGLGLTICKRIVEHHGGNIWADSMGPGKGSTFNFTLKKSQERS